MVKGARLDTLKFALAGGIFCAICVFILTLVLMTGAFPIYASVLFGTYGFLGYNISFVGAILGGIYAFIDGFIGFGVFAWIYNKLL